MDCESEWAASHTFALWTLLLQILRQEDEIRRLNVDMENVSDELQQQSQTTHKTEQENVKLREEVKDAMSEVSCDSSPL